MLISLKSYPNLTELKVNCLISILILENSVMCNADSLGIWIYQFSRDEAPNFKKRRAMAVREKNTSKRRQLINSHKN